MSLTTYKIFSWGNREFEGANVKYEAAIQVVAKRAAGCLYTVPNEYICQELGRAIGLPIPTGVVIDKDGEMYYSSLNFNITGHRLPPCDVLAVARDCPNLAVGIILFDIWIGNYDRHLKNMSYNTISKSLHIFDHGNALLYPAGLSNASANTGELGIGRHCLAGVITTLSDIWMWQERIDSIPEFFIRDKLRDATAMGLPQEEIEYCVRYLLRRRTELVDLVRTHRGTFRSVPVGMLDLLCTPQPDDYCI